MPPKPKFTKEEVIAAGLNLVAEKGMSALTARDLGAKLGSSASPIFTLFTNMEELQQEIRKAALGRFESYDKKIDSEEPLFKQVGMQMILFALEEPELYKLLYMSNQEGAEEFEDIFEILGDVAQQCIDIIMKEYGLSEQDAKSLFEHVWIHTFGIGALCATGMCRFTKERISEMLTQDFMAMMIMMKSGNRGLYGKGIRDSD